MIFNLSEMQPVKANLPAALGNPFGIILVKLRPCRAFARPPKPPIAWSSGGQTGRSGRVGIIGFGFRFGCPHFFNAIKGAHFFAENMHHHITGIDQHPIAGILPFRADIFAPALFQLAQ